MSEAAPSTVAQKNSRLLRKLLLAVAGSFAFCFSMVPMYRIACERVFGIKPRTDAASPIASAEAYAPDLDRWVTVQFDTNMHGSLPWAFTARDSTVRVHPGVATEVWFTATNLTADTLVGQAVPSIAPGQASQYFHKTECFCFTEQQLRPHETREMPVRFVVDPKLPGEVATVTLSYTFYLNDIATRRVTGAPAT